MSHGITYRGISTLGEPSLIEADGPEAEELPDDLWAYSEWMDLIPPSPVERAEFSIDTLEDAV